MLLQLLARDKSTRMMQKREENLKRLGRDSRLAAIVSQFCRLKIELIIPKLNLTMGLQRTGHHGYPKLRLKHSLSPPANSSKQAVSLRHEEVTGKSASLHCSNTWAGLSVACDLNTTRFSGKTEL